MVDVPNFELGLRLPWSIDGSVAQSFWDYGNVEYKHCRSMGLWESSGSCAQSAKISERLLSKLSKPKKQCFQCFIMSLLIVPELGRFSSNLGLQEGASAMGVLPTPSRASARGLS